MYVNCFLLIRNECLTGGILSDFSAFKNYSGSFKFSNTIAFKTELFLI